MASERHALIEKLEGRPLPEFTKDNPNCHAHCAAEWDAAREGRDFSVVPRGFAPLAPRPNAEIEDFDDEPGDNCTDAGGHDFQCTGTAYGGDDESYFGEGRCYCIHCGADGDA